MNVNHDALRALAAGLQCGDPGNPDRDREALEARLLPLVRCALRSGRGLPKLVDWVHGAARALAAPDPDRAAPRVARLLCERLVQQLQAQRQSTGSGSNFSPSSLSLGHSSQRSSSVA